MLNFLNKTYYYITITIVCFLSISFIKFFNFSNPDYKAISKKYEQSLNTNINSINTNLLEIIKKDTLKNSYNWYYNNFISISNNEVTYFVIENNSLIYYSNNNIEIEKIKDSIQNNKAFKYNESWYFPVINNFSNKQYIAVLLIKQNYVIDNEYLKNFFPRWANLNDDVKIDYDKKNNDDLFKIYKNNDYLFSLDFNGIEYNNFWFYFLISLYIIGFCALIVLLKLFVFKFFKNRSPFVKWFNFSLILFLLRSISVFYLFPIELQKLYLFNPKLYAYSFVAPSLGDLLINSILILYITIIFYKKVPAKVFYLSKNRLSIIFSVISFLTIIFYSFLIKNLIKNVVINSDIPFNLNNTLSLDIYSFIAIIIICIVFLSFYLFSIKITKNSYYLVRIFRLTKTKIIYKISALLVFVFVIPFASYYLTYDIYPIVFAFVIFFILSFYKTSLSFLSGSVIFILFFSLFISFYLNEYNISKEFENKKLILSQLSAERDPIAELLFVDIEKGIKTDTTIKRLINNYVKNESELVNYLNKNYLNGYLLRYDSKILVCNSTDSILFKNTNSQAPCFVFYKQILSDYGQETNCKSLWFLNNNNSSISYLAKLDFENNDEFLATIYIELDSKMLTEQIGFPKILIDKYVYPKIEVINYSYAKYYNNQLISRLGDYEYLQKASLNILNGSFKHYEKDNFEHLALKTNNNIVIISNHKTNVLSLVTIFSYIFIIFILFGLIVYFLLFFGTNKTFAYSFNLKIQGTIVLILLVSFLIIGIITIKYISNIYSKKNYELINEKIESILIEISHKFADIDNFNDELNDYTNYILLKFSNVFFADINIYDLNGNLYSTSRNEIFNKGLLSEKMNSKAYYDLVIQNKTKSIVTENIGQMEYISVYVPFINSKNKTIAYLNLPYFSRQDKFENELSSFIVTMINIYVFLIVMSLFITILIINRLTKPLQLIKMSLQKIRYGKINEKIEWESKDEIGILIKEYNRMVVNLEESAKLLAESERETAWREMAKQIAHEIKNPLTPMKLGIQYIQKIFNSNDIENEKKFNEISKTLIEQIDSLSYIATTFSNYAKLPKTVNNNLNFVGVVKNAINLFDKYDKTDIQLICDKQEILIFADKDEILRVVNNLIKNAIQAIEEKGEQGKIIINIEQTDKKVILSIKDNGTGISEEIKENIFKPNFTTKNSGTGLGLAITKNIIENIGGKIYYLSEQNIGTTFIVEIPY